MKRDPELDREEQMKWEDEAIGEEELPANYETKTDKLPWNLAADKNVASKKDDDQEHWKFGAGL